MNTMDQPVVREVITTARTSAMSAWQLIGHYTFAIALFYTFEDAGRSLDYFEGIVQFYRDLAQRFYNLTVTTTAWATP